MRTNRGHCATGRGRPQERSRDTEPASGSGAKGAKDGRVATAPPFPCRDGKLRENLFSGLIPPRKSVSNQSLACEFSAESKARQGTGRESSKILGSPFGIDPSALSR